MTSGALLLVLALLSISPGPLRAGGAKTTAQLKDGGEVTGELPAVTEGVLIISKTFLLSEEKLKADTQDIIRLPRNEIRKLSFSGKSYVPDGTLLGCIAGVGIGALVSYEPTGTEAYKSNFDPIGPGSRALVIGLVGGALVGGLLGKLASTNDAEIIFDGRETIPFLRDFARYQDARPPEFLRHSH
jgi:hypothetical protein